MGAGPSTGKALNRCHDIKAAPAREAVSLLAWGQNSGHQCGTGLDGLVLKPREVLLPTKEPVYGVYAGHRHSAAITSSGAVHVWGRNASGELGLGQWAHSAKHPTRAIAFDGHGAVRHVAFGHHHALFSDQAGGLWAAGSNACGQLGAGTPLPPQHEQPAESPTKDARGSVPVMVMKRHIDSRLQRMGIPAVATGESVAPYLVGIPPAVQKQRELGFADTHHTVDSATIRANTIAASAAGLRDLEELMDWYGMGLAEQRSPARVGHELEDLLLPRHAAAAPRRAISFAEVHFDSVLRSGAQTTKSFVELLEAVPRHAQHHGLPAAAFPPSSSPDEAAPPRHLPESPASASHPPPYLHGSRPLHEQYVVKVAAGSEFSMAVTGCGEVWTFGRAASYQLGTGNFVQTDPRPVSGRIAATIADNGGAVDIAVGDGFCLALARNGTVVMWGRLAPEGQVCNAARGLPGMVKVAAGRQHAIFSDGESIWQCKVGSPVQKLGFDRPTRLKGSMNGVAELAAGGDASAVIDLDGKLWMWGRIVNTTQDGTLPPARTSTGKTPLPCFNSIERSPVLITDVAAAKHVALGSNHVLVATASH